jgi:hypothetical protein
MALPALVPAPPVALPVALPATPLLPPDFDVTFNPVSSSGVAVLTTPTSTEDTTDVSAATDSSAGYDNSTSSDVSTPSISPVTSTPTLRRPTGIASLPGRFAQVASQTLPAGTSRRTREAAAFVFFDLCIWAWFVSNQDPLPGAKQAGRPYRTIYDGPSVVETSRPKTARAGSPPPLR